METESILNKLIEMEMEKGLSEKEAVGRIMHLLDERSRKIIEEEKKGTVFKD